MKCAALIALVCAGSVHAAQTIHVLVAIGNNVGDVDDEAKTVPTS